MRKNEPPKAEQGKCLLKRFDYGYSHNAPGGWEVKDLRYGLPSTGDLESKSGLVLRSGDLLLSWSKVNSNTELWKRLALKATREGLVIECRFPRWCGQIREKLEEAKTQVVFWETPAEGRVPPLYSKLSASSQLFRLHLDFEWETGLAAARGGIGLTRFAVLLSGKGPMSVRALAGETGLSPGAVRSYLGWMEEAALVRKKDHVFSLRHPLLEELFTDVAKPGMPPVRKKPPEYRKRQTKDWDPIELD